MGLFDIFDTGIMVSSDDARDDSTDLGEGRKSLEQAENALARAQSLLAQEWKGDAAIQCEQMLQSFINQVQDLIALTETASKSLFAITDTYCDADIALRDKM